MIRPPSTTPRNAWMSAGAPILVLVLVVMAFAAAVVANFARLQDRGFRTESTRLMQSAFDERVRAVANQAWDYGYWDDAYRNVTVSWDQDWLDNNYFTSIADGLIAFRPAEAAPRHSWFSEPYEDEASALAQTVFETARTAMRASPPADAERPVWSGRLDLDGQLAFFSIAPIRMMDGEAPELDYVLILEILDAEEIAEIAAARNLENAAFTPASAPRGMVALPLTAEDRILGSLVWRDERPGSAAFLGQLWPIVLTLIGIGAMTVLVARRLVAANVDTAARAEAALESSRVRAEFLSTMSHELRTPLNAIIGYAELIREEAEEADGQIGATIEADADNVLGAAKHLRQMIDDVLDHSRFDAGRMRLVIERLSIETLFAELAEVTLPLAKASGNTLAFCNDATGFDVVGDDARVRQCLMNLISNANKFTERGAVCVTARLDGGDSGARVVFDVADTGIGIEQNVLDKLFRPFTQARGAIHSAYGGAGLGLSISQKLARAMGGDITVVSEVGRGSTFSLSLPAAAAAPAPQQAAA